MILMDDAKKEKRYDKLIPITNQLSFIMKKQKTAKKETKRDRFRRLAQLRTNQVIKRLKILGNCAERSRYEYTKEDMERIFTAIDRRMNKTRAKFDLPSDKETFKL